MAESLFEKERRKQKENKKRDRESGLTGGAKDKRDATTRDYGYVGMGGSNDKNKKAADEASMPKKKKGK